MGMRKFWSVALPFSKVACAVKSLDRLYLRVKILLRAGFNIKDYPIEYRESSFIIGLGVYPLSG